MRRETGSPNILVSGNWLFQSSVYWRWPKDTWALGTRLGVSILVPRGRAPFGQHQKSRPLARSNDIPVLNGFVNTIDWDQNQSHLSDLTLSMRRVTGSPWIADFRCWTWPEVVIFGADQKERGLWGREWGVSNLFAHAPRKAMLMRKTAGMRRRNVRKKWNKYLREKSPWDNSILFFFLRFIT